MKYCAACGTALDDAAAFCSACGAQQAPAAPVEPTPVEEIAPAAPVEEVAPVAPVETAPAAPAPVATVAYPAYPPTVMPVQEEPSVGAKVMSGIGLGLAIFGFVFAFLMFIMSIGAIDTYDEDLAIGVFVMNLFMMPFSILGLSFCGSGRKGGVGGPAITGKIFGIIGVVLYGLSCLLSLATL